MKLFGIKFNKQAFVRWKIYVDRARMYIGYLNFAMIAFVFLNSINDSSIRDLLDENKFVSYPIMLLLFFTFSLILGRLDTKFGLRREEMRNASTENPVLMEILKTVQEIKDKQK
ncbi:MAG: hypothetical protein GXO81_07570 [Chlorobi bacterium]|nr:hypothetical protein [Chlorobiota bacterium]